MPKKYLSHNKIKSPLFYFIYLLYKEIKYHPKGMRTIPSMAVATTCIKNTHLFFIVYFQG